MVSGSAQRGNKCSGSRPTFFFPRPDMPSGAFRVGSEAGSKSQPYYLHGRSVCTQSDLVLPANLRARLPESRSSKEGMDVCVYVYTSSSRYVPFHRQPAIPQYVTGTLRPPLPSSHPSMSVGSITVQSANGRAKRQILPVTAGCPDEAPSPMEDGRRNFGNVAQPAQASMLELLNPLPATGQCDCDLAAS